MSPQLMVLFGKRLRYLELPANNLNVRRHFARCARITLRGSMAIMNYVAMSTAITPLFAKYGYAEITPPTAKRNPSFHLAIAKPAVPTRHMVQITTLLLIFGVRISILARISEEVAAKSARVVAVWVEASFRQWRS